MTNRLTNLRPLSTLFKNKITSINNILQLVLTKQLVLNVLILILIN